MERSFGGSHGSSLTADPLQLQGRPNPCCLVVPAGSEADRWPLRAGTDGRDRRGSGPRWWRGAGIPPPPASVVAGERRRTGYRCASTMGWDPAHPVWPSSRSSNPWRGGGLGLVQRRSGGSITGLGGCDQPGNLVALLEASRWEPEPYSLRRAPALCPGSAQPPGDCWCRQRPGSRNDSGALGTRGGRSISRKSKGGPVACLPGRAS